MQKLPAGNIKGRGEPHTKKKFQRTIARIGNGVPRECKKSTRANGKGQVKVMSNTVQYPTMATVKDAAARFGISEYFLRNLCRAGKVRFVCVGNRWLINMDSLAAYFNEGDDPAELESRHG